MSDLGPATALVFERGEEGLAVKSDSLLIQQWRSAERLTGLLKVLLERVDALHASLDEVQEQRSLRW